MDFEHKLHLKVASVEVELLAERQLLLVEVELLVEKQLLLVEKATSSVRRLRRCLLLPRLLSHEQLHQGLVASHRNVVQRGQPAFEEN